MLDRRTGIPISLAVIYLEVARRAGLRVDGVNFPGHFLLRARAGDHRAMPPAEVVIIDPFHGGAQLSEYDCRQLLRQHVGDDAAFDTTLLAARDPPRHRRPDARQPETALRAHALVPAGALHLELLLGVDPSAISELRDRGLLAYHLQDFAAALRDLEEYLRLAPKSSEHGEPRRARRATTTDDDGEDSEQAGRERRRRHPDLGAREDAAEARGGVQLAHQLSASDQLLRPHYALRLSSL